MTFQEIKSPYKNVNEALRAVVEQYPNNIAIAFYYQGEKLLTYSQLFEAIIKFANGLKTIGIKKGDKVGIMLSNTLEFVISFYACCQIGAVGCSIITMLGVDEVANISQTAELNALIIGSDKKRLVKKCQSVTPSLKTIITVGDKEMDLEGAIKFWEVVEERGSLAPINENLGLDD